MELFAQIGLGAWNFSFNGPTGIRPEAMNRVRLDLGVSAKDYREMYQDLRTMEQAAAAKMRE